MGDIGTITIGTQAGQRVSVPGPRAIFVSFAGDDDYPADGTPGFQALVRQAMPPGGEWVTIVAVTKGDCGGYDVTYAPESTPGAGDDKLKVWEQTDVATSPLIETVTTNLSGITFNLVLWVK